MRLSSSKALTLSCDSLLKSLLFPKDNLAAFVRVHVARGWLQGAKLENEEMDNRHVLYRSFFTCTSLTYKRVYIYRGLFLPRVCGLQCKATYAHFPRRSEMKQVEHHENGVYMYIYIYIHVRTSFALMTAAAGFWDFMKPGKTLALPSSLRFLITEFSNSYGRVVEAQEDRLVPFGFCLMLLERLLSDLDTVEDPSHDQLLGLLEGIKV